MHLKTYPFEIGDCLHEYAFFSEGPKGQIRKVVRFIRLHENIFNLGFGDWDFLTGDITDAVVTNNNDKEKVLATVAATVYDFTDLYPGSWIIASGTTPSRTRLYQMGIVKNLKLILSNFILFGYKDKSWEVFQLSKNYESFLVQRK